MKSFEELGREITLVRYIGSEFGTMYFEPKLPREKKRITRHLDSKLTSELLSTYEELYNAIIEWIDSTPKVKEYVFMPSLIEVGEDYFIRPFYTYDIAIRDYMDKEDEDYVEPPKLFIEMINAVSQDLSNEVSGKELIIHNVLQKSLLGPTGKTIYDNRRMNKFIIVEPKISIANLNEWKSQSHA